MKTLVAKYRRWLDARADEFVERTTNPDGVWHRVLVMRAAYFQIQLVTALADIAGTDHRRLAGMLEALNGALLERQRLLVEWN